MSMATRTDTQSRVTSRPAAAQYLRDLARLHRVRSSVMLSEGGAGLLEFVKA
jgi:hypothetical protein